MMMPKFVGILSCSGEEFPGGTVSRIAVRQVLQDLLPGNSTTICVPLFLAGDQQEVDFVKNFPCITVDGCEKRCAARGVKKIGKTPAAEFVIDTFFEGADLEAIKSGPLHDLKWKDHPLCRKLAEAIATRTVEILDEKQHK
jgi:uncharacterized metal-binding protein